MKFDFSKFKKVHADKNTTTLRHSDGHEFKIANKALNPKMREQLSMLKMADGGEVVADKDKLQQFNKRHELAEEAFGDPFANPDVKDVNDPNYTASEAVKDIDRDNKRQYPKAYKAIDGYDEGGEVKEEKPKTIGQLINYPGAEPSPNPSPKPKMADGGEVLKENTKQKTLGEIIGYPGSGSNDKQKPKYADGGEVDNTRNPMRQIMETAPPQQSPTVVINTGNMPQMPGSLVNPNPGAQAVQQQAPVAEAPQQAAPENPQNAIDYSKADWNATPQNAPYGSGPQVPAPTSQPAVAPQQSAVSAPMAMVPGSQQQASQQDPYGVQAYNQAYMQGLGEQKAGMTAEAKTAEQQGLAQSQALAQGIQQEQEQMRDFKSHYNELHGEYQNFIKDVQDQHIDPNRYMSSMNIGSKIMTAIGLIAGGIGGGLTHQENPALKFLNSQIDRDINAQKAEMGKKETLLNANMRQFGNMRDAMDMTRAMQSGIIANQLREEAAKVQGPMAKARLLQAAGALDMQAAPVLSQMAMRKTLTQSANAGKIAPETVVRLMVPQNEQGEAVKELKEAQSSYKAKDNVLSAFDQVAKLNTVGNRTMSPIQSKSQISALKDPIVAQLSKETAGRFTEQDAKMLDTLFPTMTDNAETIAKKRAQMVKMITEKLNFPVLKMWGIDMSGGGRYDNTGKSRIQESAPILPR